MVIDILEHFRYYHSYLRVGIVAIVVVSYTVLEITIDYSILNI